MMAEQIASVLEELRNATDRLFRSSNHVDLDEMEDAVLSREKVIVRLTALIEQYPGAFTLQNLESICASHLNGKRALEQMLECRNEGWITATELARDQHILKSFARFTCSPASSRLNG